VPVVLPLEVHETVTETREVGRTASVGYQIGVRWTLPTSEERMSAVLRSPAGLQIWLGGVTEIEVGNQFAFSDGTTGEIRVYKRGSHLRLAWQRSDWDEPSTVQVRVIAARTGTTLSFHLEKLARPTDRAAMKDHWEQVIGRLADLL